MPPSRQQRTRFECANPILSVAGLSGSVCYYVDVLGFTKAEWGGDTFTCVTRDDANIYLSQGDQGQPGPIFPAFCQTRAKSRYSGG
jgi:hypothetical protein